jgi:hypothetical protein
MNHEQPPEKFDRKAAADERALILAAFRTAFGGEQGQRVLAILRASAGCAPGAERPSFVFAAGSVCDTHAAAYRDGRKSIVHEIEAYLSEPEDAAPKRPASRR